jgi:hypothetical protein
MYGDDDDEPPMISGRDSNNNNNNNSGMMSSSVDSNNETLKAAVRRLQFELNVERGRGINTTTIIITISSLMLMMANRETVKDGIRFTVSNASTRSSSM